MFWDRYNVQLDVLRQLEQRVKDLILAQRRQSNSAGNQTLIKLERDFERVQGLANSAKAKVSRQQKQIQQRGVTAAMEENAAANALQIEQERFQLQIQQDVSTSRWSVHRVQWYRTYTYRVHMMKKGTNVFLYVVRRVLTTRLVVK